MTSISLFLLLSFSAPKFCRSTAMAPSSLHLCFPHKFSAFINRSHTLFNLAAILAFLSHRFFSLLLLSKPFLPQFLLFLSELFLALIWLCTRAFLWSPVSRSVFPEKLPENKELPAIDVFICTADPLKEPPLDVMNTVLSALALDYPPEKLSVYLSDDGGSSLTLRGMRLGYEFARDWIPFCRRFGVLNRCPKFYFSSSEDDDVLAHDLDYQVEKQNIKRKYEMFKESLERAETDSDREENNADHHSTIEVIGGKYEVDMPLLVYVSREKSSNYPHHFKAGALNVLLRVSVILTNAPYILVLDCDMHCNDSKSARQAMCFFLDPQASPSLAFVQFPQKFHTVNNSDIYDSQLRAFFSVWWPGMDGLQGPILSGTCFYMKRNTLYGNFLRNDFERLKQTFGLSNEYVMLISKSNRVSFNETINFSSNSLEEAHFLASSAYEEHTLWGEQVGFLYESVVEDYFTGFILHCKGWTSVLCNPSRPSFLGSGTTNLNDTLIQNTRWNCGLMEVTISRFCPLIYGLSKMSLLQRMCYSYFALQPLYSFPLWCFATLPQLCLFNGIPIYPKVPSSWFFVLSFIFLGSSLKNLQEILSWGGFTENWLNEQRIWMIKSVTAYTYGTLDAIMKQAGLRKVSFVPTNKVSDSEKTTLYRKGKFDFRTSPTLLAPIVSLLVLNVVCLVGGVARICYGGSNWNELFGQIFLSFYVIMVNFPVLEGMLWRKDEGKIPVSICLFAVLVVMVFLYIGSMAF